MSELAKARAETNELGSSTMHSRSSSARSLEAPLAADTIASGRSAMQSSPAHRPSVATVGVENRALQFELEKEKEENNLLKQR